MKKNRFSLIAVLLAAAILLSLASCGSIKPIKSRGDELKVVMTVDGQPVYYEELRYLTLNARRDMEDKYGRDCFTDPEKKPDCLAELESFVWEGLKKNTVTILCADELGIDTESSDIKKAVQSLVDTMAEQAGGKDGYADQLEDYFMTDHLLRFNFRVLQVQSLLQPAMIEKGLIDDSDEAARQLIESDEFIRTLHVYVQNDEGEDREANRKKAQKALDELNAGEKLTTVIGRYSEDVYMTTTDGYYFTYGEYEKPYEDAAMALEVGEYSDVIETSTGFYVICRQEKDPEYIEKNFQVLKDRYLYAQVDSILSERSASAKVEITEFGQKLVLTEIN